MARIVGGIGTSHIPAIGLAMARKQFDEPYWKPFFEAYRPVRAWLDAVRPTVAIVVYNDHGLNFFLDKMPAFAVGAAAEYRNADEGWGLPTLAPFPGDAALSWHLIERLAEADFDLTTCQEMLVDHGFVVPMQLLWPDATRWPVRAIPIHVNTVQHPLPSPRRCLKLGEVLGRAIESWPANERVIVLGTGGLSHQLDGRRAGFINKPFDLYCLEKIVTEPEVLANYSIRELVELAGTQGPELIQWLVMRGALGPAVRKLEGNYHVPISNTGSGMLLLEKAA
ncbi:MAG TPA: class III extradiol dioxygenase family protein [Steroidobacteraceae bacterium]|nr:class III extradiol dioxygenase family protein [Steroidobacteraceae bacterium]